MLNLINKTWNLRRKPQTVSNFETTEFAMKAFNPQQAIIVSIITLLVSFACLEYYGYIKHSNDDDRMNTGAYRSILLTAGESYKMSAKQADKTARCIQGYLALEFAHNGMPAGFLVDEKNRGIRCAQWLRP